MSGTPRARTKFIRKLAESRPSGHDAYIEELIRIERSLMDAGPRGVASTMQYLNLISRYPRETEAIAQELGTPVLQPVDDTRIEDILGDRLRLAEERLLAERRVAGEFGAYP